MTVRKLPATGAPSLTESQRYVKAMVDGNDAVMFALETKHGLFGYPPELVSVGLAAVDRGEDPNTAVEAYLEQGACGS